MTSYEWENKCCANGHVDGVSCGTDRGRVIGQHSSGKYAEETSLSSAMVDHLITNDCGDHNCFYANIIPLRCSDCVADA